MKENQNSVWAWVLETFGRPETRRALGRLMEEVAELRAVRLLSAFAPLEGPRLDDILEECADVVICMYSFAASADRDLHELIDRKMQKNRGRKWRRMGDGTGYHVRDEPSGGSDG